MSRPAGFKIRHWTDDEARRVLSTVPEAMPLRMEHRHAIFAAIAKQIDRTARAVRNKWYELKPIE